MNCTRFLAERFKKDSNMMVENVSRKSGLKHINLGIGDIDIHTEEEVIRDAFSDVLDGHTHYTNSMGCEELRAEISKYHREEFENYDFSTDEVIVLSGGCHGMYTALKAITNPGDEIIVFAPYFPVYIDQIKNTDGIPVVVKTRFENNYQINRDELEEKISEKTKAIIVNTPSNPTGICYTAESLNIIAEAAKKHDLLVLADDIYDFYSYEDSFTPIYTLEGMKERTVSVCSFSKNFAMTGWRIGYNIGPKEIIECIKTINECIVYSTAAPSQRAALSALKNRKKIKNKLVSIFKERVQYCYDRIQGIPSLQVFQPQGGIYLFVNVEKTGLSSDEFAKKLNEECGITVIPGNPFGDSSSVRIACSVPLEELKEAFDRIENFLNKISEVPA